MVGAGLSTFAAQSANAATTLLSCSGLHSIATLNPAIGSGNSKYVKAVTADSTGLKFDLFNLPIPADAFACVADAGIRTNQPGQSALYTLDDQTNGNAFLTTSGALSKTTSIAAGSSSCNSTDPLLTTAYPTGYPLQGKTIVKFDQLTPTLVQIQSQTYIRLGRDPLETSPLNITVKGIVIKGPGLGGDTNATLSFFPTNSIKNLNALDCTGNPSLGTASLAELHIQQADGPDADALIDPWTVTIP